MILRLNNLITFVVLVIFGFVLVSSYQPVIIVSPSHPFVDDNKNGIDDFEELNKETEAKAKKYGVKFPITELGNCKSYHECKSYCEDPVNGAGCIAYAKKKGFHKEDALGNKKEEILGRAKKEFGCDSYSSCKAFCEVPTNYDKCNNFAKSNDLLGGHVASPEEKQFLDKAKQVLGCNTPESCKNFCDNQDNRVKCESFAKSLGLRGGEVIHGPGGCSSEETCRAFCSDPANFQECAKFGSAQGAQGSGKQAEFRGPGGCNSEESCRNYCEKNPTDCKIISPTGLGLVDDPAKAAEEYKKFCQSNPGKCQSNGEAIFSSKDARLEFERFCTANPDSCGAKSSFHEDFEQRRRESQEFCSKNPDKCIVGPGGYVDPGEYCKTNPDRCRKDDFRYDRGNYNPAEMCAKAPNCKWESGTCKCGFYDGSGEPKPSGDYRETQYQGNYNNSREQQEASCRAGGGTCKAPTQNYQPPTQNYQPPAGESYKGCPSGQYWNGSHCVSSTSGSGGSTGTYQSAPSGMSREQQEQGCRSCGGTCNWSGDSCNCQCGSTSNSTTTQAPPPTQTEPPPPPPSQPTQEPTQQTTTTTSCPSGYYMQDGNCIKGVEGVSTSKFFLQNVIDYLFNKSF